MPSNDGSPSPAPALPSYWWLHGINSFLFLLMSIAALLRLLGRLKADSELPAHAAHRHRYTRYIFSVLTVYSLSRSIVEGLIAGSVVPGVGTFGWSTVTSIPGVFFGCVQTTCIARWVNSVEDLVYEMRHTRFRIGAVAVTSSAALLLCFAAATVFSVVDHYRHMTSMHKEDWSTLLDIFTGILYVFNGTCFLALGTQLAYFWQDAADSTHTQQLKILAIAAVFVFMCMARGVIMVIFSFHQDSTHLNSVVGSNWGAPTVLLVEWSCLVVSLFVLQPPMMAELALPALLALGGGSATNYSTTLSNTGSDITPRSSGVLLPTAPTPLDRQTQPYAFASRRDVGAIEALRTQYILSARNDSFGGGDIHSMSKSFVMGSAGSTTPSS